MSPVAKTTAQRLNQWEVVLGQYDYTIMHIAGHRNCWGDLLSRWVTAPSVSVRVSAVYAASEPDETLPFKQVIQDAQQASRANLGTLAAGATSFMTDDMQATLDDEGIVRLHVNGRALLWIPGGAKQLQARLMVCAHMKEAGHRGAVATLQRLTECCRWFRTEEHVDEFVKQCLHYMDDLFVGASGPLGDDGLDKDGGYSYTLVMMDDMSNWVWLEPTGA